MFDQLWESLSYLSRHVPAPSCSLFRRGGLMKTLWLSHISSGPSKWLPSVSIPQLNSVKLKEMTWEMRNESWNIKSPQLYSSCIVLPYFTHWQGREGEKRRINVDLRLQKKKKKCSPLHHEARAIKERLIWGQIPISSSSILRHWRGERQDEAWLLRAPDTTGSFSGQTLRGRGSEPQ